MSVQDRGRPEGHDLHQLSQQHLHGNAERVQVEKKKKTPDGGDRKKEQRRISH